MASITEFYQKKSLVFQGGNNLEVAKYWIEEVNKMLVAVGVTNNTTKILLATNQLRDPAEL